MLTQEEETKLNAVGAHLRTVYKSLQFIRNNGPRNTEAGIDGNAAVPLIVREALCPGWEHYSGNPEYPISSPDMSPDELFVKTQNKWEGRQGQLRYELLDYLLEKIAQHPRIKAG